jgi:hypothetical protein
LFGADLGLADLDEEIFAAEGCLGWDQSKGDVGFEEWSGGAGGDDADLFAFEVEDGITVAGDAAVDHFETYEFAGWTAGGLDFEEGLAADEVAFVELEEAVEVGFKDVDGVGYFVAVEAHSGFKTEGIARAEATGTDAELLTGNEEFVPDFCGCGFVCGEIELETVFAGVAGAGDEDVGDAGDCAKCEPVIFDCGEIDGGEFAEGLKGAWALESELGVVAGVVGDVDGRKAADLPANPGVVFVFGAGVDYEEIVIGAETMDEDIVDEGSLRSEQGGVLGLAVFETGSVVHGDVLNGGQRAGTAELNLAHVGDVKQTDGGADGEMLGEDACSGTGVLDRHIPAAEVDHFGVVGAVSGVEGGLFQFENGHELLLSAAVVLCIR